MAKTPQSDAELAEVAIRSVVSKATKTLTETTVRKIVESALNEARG